VPKSVKQYFEKTRNFKNKNVYNKKMKLDRRGDEEDEEGDDKKEDKAEKEDKMEVDSGVVKKSQVTKVALKVPIAEAIKGNSDAVITPSQEKKEIREKKEKISKAPEVRDPVQQKGLGNIKPPMNGASPRQNQRQIIESVYKKEEVKKNAISSLKETKVDTKQKKVTNIPVTSKPPTPTPAEMHLFNKSSSEESSDDITRPSDGNYSGPVTPVQPKRSKEFVNVAKPGVVLLPRKDANPKKTAAPDTAKAVSIPIIQSKDKQKPSQSPASVKSQSPSNSQSLKPSAELDPFPSSTMAGQPKSPEQMAKNAALKKKRLELFEFRQNLPIYECKEALMREFDTNGCLVVIGETGEPF